MPWRWAIFNRDVNCFFHFVRRFWKSISPFSWGYRLLQNVMQSIFFCCCRITWNQVLIWTSVRFSVFDNSMRLLTLRYLSCLNSFSSFSNCLTLYAWRGLRSMPGLRERFPNNFGPNCTQKIRCRRCYSLYFCQLVFGVRRFWSLALELQYINAWQLGLISFFGRKLAANQVNELTTRKKAFGVYLMCIRAHSMSTKFGYYR